MGDMEIRVSPEADDFLYHLPDILIQEGYKNTLASAMEYVKDIMDFIHRLPFVPHHPLSPLARLHYSHYGENLRYAFFKRKRSPQTTWYVFFIQRGNQILVKHISNN